MNPSLGVIGKTIKLFFYIIKIYIFAILNFVLQIQIVLDKFLLCCILCFRLCWINFMLHFVLDKYILHFVLQIVFGRSVTPLQMMGCILIVLSIPTAKCSDLLFSHQPTGVTPYILVLSQASAFLSTVAAVTVEVQSNQFEGCALQNQFQSLSLALQ